MLLFKSFVSVFEKNKLNLDCVNAACMSHHPFYIQSRDRFFLHPSLLICHMLVGSFIHARLFLKGVSSCVAVGAFAVYPFVSFHNCKF